MAPVWLGDEVDAVGEAVEDEPTGAAEPPSVVVDVDTGCVLEAGPVGAGSGVSPLDCED